VARLSFCVLRLSFFLLSLLSGALAMKRRAFDAALLRRLRGLLRLGEAAVEAREAEADTWQFAVPIDVLNKHSSLTNGDVQWLVNEGLIEHRTETTRAGAKKRTFRQDGAIHTSARVCFVTTEVGLRLARDMCEVLHSRDSGACLTPHWDAATRHLRFRGGLVKSLPITATTQGALLEACERARWVNPIPNPWAEMPPGKRSRHLRRALDHLNSNQQEVPIHFSSRDKARTFFWSPANVD
jgi:hypothetical protein